MRTPRLALAVALSALVTGCPGGPNTVRKVSLKPTEAPGTAAPVLLGPTMAKPTGASTALAGSVTLDAGYIARQGIGHVTADGSAYAVAEASLIASNGANVIANNSGNLLGDAGGNLLSNHGGGVIANNAGNLVANNAGNLVSEAGGALIGKIRYALTDAERPALGTPLPIAGILVGVVSLVDGKLLALGNDGAGKPVYAVHTDAKGHYQFFLSPDLAGTVRVVAGVPGTSDGRLLYGLLTGAKTGEAAVNEEAVAASDYVRRSLTDVAEVFISPSGATAALDAKLVDLPVAAREVIKLALAPFARTTREAGGDKLTPPRFRRATQRVLDTAMADIDLTAFTSHVVEGTGGWNGAPSEPSVATLEQIFATVDRAAAVRLAADPNAFANAPWLRAANERRGREGLPAAALLRPSDLSRFLIDEYITADSERRQLAAMLPLVDLGVPATEGRHLQYIYRSLYVDLLLKVFEPDRLERILASVHDEVTAETTPGLRPDPVEDPPASPPPPVPTEAPYTVGTLVQTAGKVQALAFGKDGDLYFTEADTPTIRKVAMGDPAHPIAVVAGGKEDANIDGPLAKARFTHPQILLPDPTAAGTAFYVSAGGFVRQLVLDGKGGGTVTTLAGTGTGGDQDGPGASAQIAPLGLVLDGHGGLLVVQPVGAWLRRIDLADPQHAVTTLAPGKGQVRDQFGFAGNGLLDPRGGVFVTDTAGFLWRIDEQGLAHAVVGGDYQGHERGGWYADVRIAALHGLAADTDGSLLVTDAEANTILRVRVRPDGTGDATVLAGQGVYDDGMVDGPGDQAKFHEPLAITVGPDGTIYVADSENQRIRTLRRVP